VAAYGFRVPVWHDPELAQRLGGIAAGEPVPVDAYAAVAAALTGSGSVAPRGTELGRT
jgi:type III secretion system FlhB-like substrate exporter